MSVTTLHTTLTANSENDITIGSTALHRAIFIWYTAVRGLLIEVGQITVVNDTDLPMPTASKSFDDCGLWSDTIPLAMKITGTNLILSITVDDTSEDDVAFSYFVKEIKI